MGRSCCLVMSTQSGRKSFLIVDDEPIVRMELAEVVRECGYEPWEAGSTAEALGILERAGDAFSGLITDINMPGTRNGMVLANHVRFMWPHIKIVVVSAGRKPFSGEMPDNARFVPKPWNEDLLTSAIALN